MKKIVFLILSIIIISPSMAQDSSEKDYKSKRGFITSYSFTTSIQNDNKLLSVITDIDNINLVNMGFDFKIGHSTSKGFEYSLVAAFEFWNNKQNNKQLNSLSSLLNLNFGYGIAFCDNLSIVPSLGIGWNPNTLNYSNVTDKDISYNELSLYSWNVEINNNFYVPASLEIRYRTSKYNYFILGAEYRYFFHYGNTKVFQTSQRVYDFPRFSANELAFKIGFVSKMHY